MVFKTFGLLAMITLITMYHVANGTSYTTSLNHTTLHHTRTTRTLVKTRTVFKKIYDFIAEMTNFDPIEFNFYSSQF